MSPATIPGRSTGPRTAAGIENCKYNATKHGLTGSQIVVKGENPADYDALRAALHAEHQPASEEECMLVERIAQNWWKLQRAERYERDVVQAVHPDRLYSDPRFVFFFRYKTTVERNWDRARRQLAELKKKRAKEQPQDPTPLEQPRSPRPEQSVLAISTPAPVLRMPSPQPAAAQAPVTPPPGPTQPELPPR